MDPYQGLQMGSRDQAEGHFFDDMGMGMPGALALVGAEVMYQRGGYLPFITKGVGPQGTRRLLKQQRARAFVASGRLGGARPGYRGLYNEGRSRVVRGAGFTMRDPVEVTQYRRLRRDMFDKRIGGRYPNNPMAALYDEAGGSFRRLQSKYGTRAASRVWGVTQLGKISRVTGMVSLAYLGADLASGIMEGIMNYEPPGLPAGGVNAEMGGQFVPDTRTAWTQRQASLMAIHQSGLQARSALGNEASFLH